MSSWSLPKERASMAAVVAVVEGEVEVIVAPSGEITWEETGDL